MGSTVEQIIDKYLISKQDVHCKQARRDYAVTVS